MFGHIAGELVSHGALDQLRDKGKIRDRAIVIWRVQVEVVLLQDRCQLGVLEEGRHDTLPEGEVDNGC